MRRSRGATWGAAGAVLAGLAVAGGAFGAHALRTRLDEGALAIWETAARYQMYHSLALLATTTRHASHNAPLLQPARWLFLAGILLFSGSLYALALTGVTGLGAVTPFGGLAFLAGWSCLAVALLRARSSDAPAT